MMGRTRQPEDEVETLGQFMERLGSVPLDRILMSPAPGTATEEDLLRVSARRDRLYELVDGVLVEKAVGTPESLVGGIVGRLLGNYVEEHDLGVVLPADAMLRLAPGLVRVPDVC